MRLLRVVRSFGGSVGWSFVRLFGRSFVGSLVLVALLGAGAAADPAPGAGSATSSKTSAASALRREIEATNRAMSAAFDRGDLAAVSRFYADDARMLSPGGEVVRGRKALDAYWTRIEHPRTWKLEVLEVGGSAQEPWQLGRSTLITGAPGKERTSIVDFILLWRRQSNGELKVYVDMYVPARIR